MDESGGCSKVFGNPAFPNRDYLYKYSDGAASLLVWFPDEADTWFVRFLDLFAACRVWRYPTPAGFIRPKNDSQAEAQRCAIETMRRYYPKVEDGEKRVRGGDRFANVYLLKNIRRLMARDRLIDSERVYCRTMLNVETLCNLKHNRHTKNNFQIVRKLKANEVFVRAPPLEMFNPSSTGEALKLLYLRCDFYVERRRKIRDLWNEFEYDFSELQYNETEHKEKTREFIEQCEKAKLNEKMFLSGRFF